MRSHCGRCNPAPATHAPLQIPGREKHALRKRELVDGVFTSTQKHTLAKALTGVMVKFEGSEAFRQVTWVLIEELHTDGWHIGGEPFVGSPSVMGTLGRSKDAFEMIDGTPISGDEFAAVLPPVDASEQPSKLHAQKQSRSRSKPDLPSRQHTRSNQMQYIVITRRRSEKFLDSDYTPERLAAETAAVRKLYGDGIVRHIWHRGDVGGACLLLEVESEDGVKSALDRLPLFGLGMQEAVSIVPLAPYRGFATE